jgi:hypothetical protein
MAYPPTVPRVLDPSIPEEPMAQVKIGALCWNQYTEWPALLDDAGANPGWPRIASVTTSGASEGPPNLG